MKIARRAAGIIGLLVIWQLGSVLTTDIFCPGPVAVFEAFIGLIRSGQLVKGIQYSFCRILVSASLSLLISIPAAVLIYGNRFIHELFFPLIGMFRFVPITAFSGLLILWFGLGEGYKIAFLTLASVVYMLPSVLLSLQEIPTGQVEAARALGMTKWQTIRHVVLTYAAPSIASSFLLMIAIGCNYINVVESVNAYFGLGYTISVAAARGKTAIVFSMIATIMVISYLIDLIGNALIRRAFKWKYIK